MPACKRCGEAYDPESKSACASGLCRGIEVLRSELVDDTCYVDGKPWPYQRAQMTWVNGTPVIAPYQSDPSAGPDPPCEGDQLRWDGKNWVRVPGDELRWEGKNALREPSRPHPDNLMRLLTSLERRLLDAECGYIELEQGLSVQEEEVRKLREQANSQWVQIDRLKGNSLIDETEDEVEAKAGCDCHDYVTMWNYWTRALDDAEVAASDYHAAWQDAAVYWKGEVARLEQELLFSGYDRARAELNVNEAQDFASRCWAYVLPSAQRHWHEQGQLPAWIEHDADADD